MTARPLPQPIDHAVNWLMGAVSELHAVARADPTNWRRIHAADQVVEAARTALRVRIWQAIDAEAKDAERAERIFERQIRRGDAP